MKKESNLNEFEREFWGGVYEAVEGLCIDCAFFSDHDGCESAPHCTSDERDDKREIIWVKKEERNENNNQI